MDNLKNKDKKNENGQFILFIFNKFERITTAVYMVTEFLSDKEPLKGHIRKKSIKLLSFILSLKDNISFLSEKSVSDMFLFVSEMESLLNIASSAKIISKMNCSILVDEYKKVLDLIIENRKDNLKNFLEKQNYKGHYYKGQEIILKDIKLIKDKITINSSKTKLLKSNNNDDDKLKRKSAILKVIKDKKEINIKDILKEIKGYGEKTVQRDLTRLVDEGVLEKIGERRWSRYSLKM